MLRLGKLESKVENIYNATGGNLTNGTSTSTPTANNPEKVNVAGTVGVSYSWCGILLCNMRQYIWLWYAQQIETLTSKEHGLQCNFHSRGKRPPQLCQFYSVHTLGFIRTQTSILGSNTNQASAHAAWPFLLVLIDFTANAEMMNSASADRVSCWFFLRLCWDLVCAPTAAFYCRNVE